MSKAKNLRPLSEPEYLALGEFRYQVRRFLRHMEEATRELSANPQQYQLVLAIKGLPHDIEPNISSLAERMQLNHNSMVELVDRCEERGLIRRTRSGADRRQVELAITADGYASLRKLASAARQELRAIGPSMAQALQSLLEDLHLPKSGNEDGRQRLGKARKSQELSEQQRSRPS